MIRATRVLPAGSWKVLNTDTVALDFDGRHRRRVQMKGLRGLEFLLDLPEAVALRNGDGLALEDGRVVMVKAAPEPLLEVRAADAGKLLRLAWHLGNRHLPAQLLADRILIRRDHVIADMLRGLGATLAEIDAPFDPEGGAYGGAHAAAQSHAHSEGDGGHSHSHAHAHGHSGHRHG
ncbi:MAG TPA: urease accessory protein UreE [Bauldia sp.]|nr:urease accessory protein UreE [Bauldia sp.]